MVGATDKVEVCNAKELNIDKTNIQKWKYSLARLLNKQKGLVDDITYEAQLEEIILYIINKVDKEYALYKNLIDEMKEMFGFNKFSILTKEEKEKVIIEMLILLKSNSKTANMKFLNSSYSMAFGKKNGRIISNAYIINKSVTGIRTIANEF